MDFLLKKWSETPINRSRKVVNINKQDKVMEVAMENDHSVSITPQMPQINNTDFKENIQDDLRFITNASKELVKLTEDIAKLHCTTRMGKNTVIGRGDFNSPIMFMGEAPGEEENKQQMPFVGASGKLLDKMLNAAGIDRNKIYITNMFFWQPDNNRTPNNQELELAMPYVQKHIEIQQPKLIITLGAVATKGLIKNEQLVTKLRGTFQTLTFDNNFHYDVFVTFHPAYILRNHQYAKYEEDFKLIRKFLEDNQLYDRVKI